MIRPVKIAFVALLMFWFGLQVGWAQVHATQDSAHAIVHAVDGVHLDHGSPDAGDDGCGVSHCSPTVGIVRRGQAAAANKATTAAQAGTIRWRALMLVPDIERPKWALTTPAVVSL